MSKSGSRTSVRIKLYSREQLERLSTPRLLAYKNRLMRVVETPDWDDPEPGRMTKQSPKWKAQHALVLSVLATREHVPRKGKP